MDNKSNVEGDKALRIARSLVDAYPEKERANLLNWSRSVLSIRQTREPAHKKLIQIGRVTKETGVAATFLKHLAAEIKRISWDERTKPVRGVIGGAGIGLLASVAGPMAGVAAFGGAVAVPVVLLSAGAGAILTAIADDISRSG